jgi:hypothetical protein
MVAHPSARASLLATLLAFTAATLPAQESSGVGDLAIMPTRIVLSASDRTTEVMLINAGSSEATYRISFVEMAMTADGRLREVDPEDAPWSAASLIRYSPRQVTLAPGTSQVVRMQILRRRDLPPGEYRSHLLVRGVPPTMPRDATARPGGITTEIVPVYGVTIPVILREGEVWAGAELANPVLRADGTALEVELRRSGNGSLFGDLEIEHRASPAEEPTPLFRSKVAVYPPNEARAVVAPLQFPGSRIPSAGEIVVRFRDGAAGAEDTVSLNLEGRD